MWQIWYSSLEAYKNSKIRKNICRIITEVVEKKQKKTNPFSKTTLEMLGEVTQKVGSNEESWDFPAVIIVFHLSD